MKPFGWVWSKDDASRVFVSDKQRGWLGGSGAGGPASLPQRSWMKKKHGNAMILPLLLGLPNSVSSASEFDTNLPRNRRDLNEIGIASSDAVGRGISFEGAFSDASGGLGYENSGLRAPKLGRGRLSF